MKQPVPDKPGAIAPPPLIFLPCLLIGMAVDYVWPVAVLQLNIRIVAGGILILFSFVPVIWAVRHFRKEKTSFDVRKPASRLITSGPFQWSRNPIYVAMTMLIFGIAVAMDSIWVLLSLLPALVVMHYGVIIREEAYLERKFGQDYIDYKSKVRRWI